ncbi:DUF6033 family protein [Anaerosporobacter faecicola]|uniref:DUF6033 family protein n=1 Tax=Anaerosporobacter faecicola TaxID=2718714 RepID=UPI00143A881E|nr:DUF6033 family protein [Anaerosporobacter faecicola]
MSHIEQASYLASNGYSAQQFVSKTDKNAKTEDTKKSNSTSNTETTETTEKEGAKSVKGTKTYGDAKLTDQALDYYNALKKKFGNLNFVLVASDKKEEAQMNKASFATPGCLTVLIDTDKIEKMEEDSTYREQIESVIRNGASSMSQLTSNINQSSTQVTSYGMTIDKSGNASYFAVLSKSAAAQKERIAKKAEEKKADKKAEEKKAQKEEAKENQAEKLSERKEAKKVDVEDTVTISANSIEELMKKIQEYQINERTSYVRTDAEKAVGQSFDYTI